MAFRTSSLSSALMPPREDEPLHRPGVLDHSGAFDVGGDVRDPAHHGRVAKRRAQQVVLLDAVLKRDDAGAGTDERPHRADGGVHIPQLHRQPHHVGDPDVRRVVRSADTRQMKVAERALDPQAAGAHRLEVPSARDEMHVRPGLLQPRPEVPPDPTRTNDRDTHE
jgi:hypothetical protein